MAPVSSNELVLLNYEHVESCRINLGTHSVEYFSEMPKCTEISGAYYKSGTIFFGLIKTKRGPVIYYQQKLYLLTPELTISLYRQGETNVFKIDEYDINIEYRVSQFKDFDAFSSEMDIDLFVQIASLNKDKAFRKLYTINESYSDTWNVIGQHRSAQLM